MPGVVVIVIVMLLAIPVGTMLAGAAWSALLGEAVCDDTERRHGPAAGA